MTWTVNLSGHDDLSADAKEEFERGLVSDIRDLVSELTSSEGVNVTSAQVTTNTTGTVDVTVEPPESESEVDDDPDQAEDD